MKNQDICQIESFAKLSTIIKLIKLCDTLNLEVNLKKKPIH